MPLHPTRTRRLLTLSLLALLLGACTAPVIETRHRDWSDYDGEGAELLAAPEMELPVLATDPAEPSNRKLEGANRTLVKYGAGPVASGWRFVFPEMVRNRIGNVGTNLAFPKRAVNGMLQGEWSNAGTELVRFVINSTIGLLGLFDPADSWGIAAPAPQDTGLTFVQYGWEQSDSIFVPLVGPSTKRDLLGMVPDALLDISFWLSGPLWLVFSINEGADAIPTYQKLVETQGDAYALIRLAWGVSRAAQVADFNYRPGDAPANHTMQAVFITPADRGFAHDSETGLVSLESTGRELPYSTWMQSEPAPVAYLLPGLGSHRMSNQPVTVAESLFNEGWSVVVFSSMFHPEFIGRALSSPLVGYAPRDADDLHEVLDLIDQQLVAEYGEQHLQKRALMGISMGAFQSAYMAGLQRMQPDDRVQFDQFAAFGLPVSLKFALRQLDGYYHAPENWPEEEQTERMVSVLRRALQLGDGTFRPGNQMPFSEDEARFLIGLSFRLTMLDVLWATQTLEDRGVLLTERTPLHRSPAYWEMIQYGWEEYFYAFVLPWLKDIGAASTGDEVFAACDLRAVEAGLRKNERLWVFASEDDFLRRPEDSAWLEATLLEGQVSLQGEGGHLGGGWDPVKRADVVRELLQEIQRLEP